MQRRKGCNSRSGVCSCSLRRCPVRPHDDIMFLTRALRSSKTQVCEPKMAMKSQCRFRTNMPIEPGATVMFGSIQRGPAVVPAAAASHSAPVTDPFSTPTHNAKDTRNVSGACSGLTQTEVRLGITGSRNIAKRELQGLAKVCFPGSVNMR